MSTSVCVSVCVCRGQDLSKQFVFNGEMAWSLGVTAETVTTHWNNEAHSTGGQTAHDAGGMSARWQKQIRDQQKALGPSKQLGLAGRTTWSDIQKYLGLENEKKKRSKEAIYFMQLL